MANSNPFNYSPEFLSEKERASSVYILTDVNRNELVLGVTPQIENLKRFVDLSSSLNPRYGAPAANRLIYFKSFSNSVMANHWLLQLNHFTRIQKERIIVSDNPNWSNLWEHPNRIQKATIFTTLPENKERNKSRRKKMLGTLHFEFSKSFNKLSKAIEKDSFKIYRLNNRSQYSNTCQSETISSIHLNEYSFSNHRNSFSKEYFSSSSIKESKIENTYTHFLEKKMSQTDNRLDLSSSIKRMLCLNQIDLFENYMPLPPNKNKSKGKKIKTPSNSKKNRAEGNQYRQEYSLF